MSTTPLQSPKGLQLHPEARRPMRVSKRAGILGLIVIAAVLILIIFGAYRRRAQQEATTTAERDSKTSSALGAGQILKADLAKQPKRRTPYESNLAGDSSTDLTPPPLEYKPGELGNPSTYTQNTGTHELTAEEKRRQLAYQHEMDALSAPSTVQAAMPNSMLSNASRDQGRAQDVTALPNLLSASYNPQSQQRPMSGLNSLGALLGGGSTSDDSSQNGQDQKQDFLNNARQRRQENYLKSARTAQLGPYEIKAGWDIPAVLEQAMNSDLPGEVRALVRSNVYDTASGDYLLIPQGARLVGEYNSNVSYGQDGLQVVWNRIIFPDGSSMNLDGMNGQDEKGFSGFRDKVDRHYKRLFGTALLTSLFSAGLQLSQNNRGGQNTLSTPTPGQTAGQAVGTEVTQVGVEITKKNLNVQPTIKIPIGYRFNVRVNRDLLFDSPYHPYPQQ